MARPNLFAKQVAEFLGVFAIVFFGCGSVAVAQAFELPALLGAVPLVFGATVCLMVYATGHLSGAHMNPAVTLAFASVRRFPWAQVPAYLLAQVVGGIAACACIWLIVPGSTTFASTQPAIPVPSALVLEGILTFFLMFVVKAVATDSRAVGTMAGIAIGITVMVAALFGGTLTGASMNPARSIGPALFELNLSYLWIYLVGPTVGAVLGAHTYQFIRCGGEKEQPEVRGCC